MIKEIWKPIEGYPDYMVSNLGRVKSLNFNRSGKEQIMKPTYWEYLCVFLKGKRKRVHKLVAEAFIPNPNNLPCINHKNEDKTDNRVDNLEWCDYRYNVNYGSRNEKVASKLSKPILQLNLNGELVKIWNSGREIRRELGTSVMNCKDCMCYGYKWDYEKDYKKIKFNVFNLNIYERIV